MTLLQELDLFAGGMAALVVILGGLLVRMYLIARFWERSYDRLAKGIAKTESGRAFLIYHALTLRENK